MGRNWVNQGESGTDAFEGLHAGLTVGLIATPRADFETCSFSDTVNAVVKRNDGLYDFLPVVESKGDEHRIVGLFRATDPCLQNIQNDELVQAHYYTLSEQFLVGADASILEFIRTADGNPCQLVVSGENITGLVSLSDLQKLPVRAALFALITGLEISMAEAIRANTRTSDDWMTCLTAGRRQELRKQISRSRKGDGFVDELLFTQFGDKSDILLQRFDLPSNNGDLKHRFSAIRELRNNLAHSNEYAATPEEARKVCAIVRDLLHIQSEVRNLYSSG